MSLAKIEYVKAANYYLEMMRAGSREELHVAEAAMKTALELASKEQALEGSIEKWEDWHPPFSPFVVGRFTQREFDADGLPLAQKVECTCKQCGAKWQTLCTSGLVRQHIQRFALVHLHRDPFG